MNMTQELVRHAGGGWGWQDVEMVIRYSITLVDKIVNSIYAVYATHIIMHWLVTYYITHSLPALLPLAAKQ